jgi:hypothetical protein
MQGKSQYPMAASISSLSLRAGAMIPLDIGLTGELRGSTDPW